MKISKLCISNEKKKKKNMGINEFKFINLQNYLQFFKYFILFFVSLEQCNFFLFECYIQTICINK